MSIRYIPNDPLAIADVGIRRKKPRANRSATRAGFDFFNAVPEGVYDVGTSEFLFWQCRESALTAVAAWERVAGTLRTWARATPNPKRLSLIQNGGDDLNAYYDGESLAFFEHTTGTKTTFSGASTDVVAHECGHGFLDAIRPDLWSSTYTEVGAFHEAFGDCMALVTAFSDRATRSAVLRASSSLAAKNFLEATAEDLSDGVRRELGSTHPAAAPRHAFNTYQWQLPSTLPSSGPPSQLTSEIHSFGRIFSGCFYDLVRNIFQGLLTHTQASLGTAVRTAAKILVAGARTAPETPRFFQAVGRTMVAADADTSAGRNRSAITEAFARHGIALASAAILAPAAVLEGAAPKLAAAGKRAGLSTSTLEDIRRRIAAAPRAKMSVLPLSVGSEAVALALHHREVPLGDVDSRLKGVVALSAESVLVGKSNKKAALLGRLPEANATIEETQSFVRTLLKHSCIGFGTQAKSAVARRSRAGMPTHTIRTMDGKKMLVRVRFSCPGCG